VTKDNLDVVLKAGYIKKDALCKGIDGAKVAVCK
jgi:D-xylose transport system substrate-binding protein